MDTLKVHSQTITLVDQVEDKLLNYLKEKWKEISLRNFLFMLIQHILYL